MTFPSSGPGYPPQGGGPHSTPQGPGTGSFPPVQPPAQGGQGGGPQLDLSLILALAVAVLGLVHYFIGFSGEAEGAAQPTIFFLVGGLLAGLRALPGAPKVLPFAALFSVLGAFTALDGVINYGSVPFGPGFDIESGPQAEVEVPGIITVIVILGFLQMLAAIAALLFDAGVLKLPVAKPQGQPGPYGQPSQQQYAPQQPQGQQQPGQYAPQQPVASQQATQYAPHQGSADSGGFAAAQPTQYTSPATPPPNSPGQQATTYSPQQGQFYSQNPGSGDATQVNPGTGTPPGGFGKP